MKHSMVWTEGIPNVETFFGTAPVLWNRLFVLMAKLIPKRVLQNRDQMNLLARVSLPMVRLVDTLVGSTNAIRVDVTTRNPSEKTLTAVLSHRDLEKCVGDAIAAFALELLPHNTAIPVGVSFPEEMRDTAVADRILDFISRDAIAYRLPVK